MDIILTYTKELALNGPTQWKEVFDDIQINNLEVKQITSSSFIGVDKKHYISLTLLLRRKK